MFSRTAIFFASSIVLLPFTPRGQGQSDTGRVEVVSKLGRRLESMQDDDAIRAAKAKLAANPGDAKLYLGLSLAEAAQRQYKEAIATDTAGLAKFPENGDLLLERGHRELGVREFAAAERDLKHAVTVAPSKLDAHYHLGLAFYFQGRFEEAGGSFEKARALATSDDSLIDCSNWLYVSLRRANKNDKAAAALTRITPAVHNTEPHLLFYLRLLRFYQGQMTEAQILPATPAAGDTEAELSYNTINYGVGNWHLYNGDTGLAKTFFRKVVSGEAWNSWGFVGSEVELARSKTEAVSAR